ncbi:MAG: SGNH/GDSL hydrolase family protein [Clostridia bacterium]|nr:SGNH/GDSL hydrolase family protein [Clostridia bacterium]
MICRCSSGIWWYKRFITTLQRAYIDKGCNLKYATSIKNSLGYSLEDVANVIKKVCKVNNILVFDLYNNCDINTMEDCIRYIPDGLHPSKEYHEILDDKIYNYIIKL